MLDHLISPEYREQNRLMHEQHNAKGKPWGMSGWRYVDDVFDFAYALRANTILDYGCGSGSMKAGLLDLKIPADIREYDPALPGKDDMPMLADLVVCTDVMEHVEEERADAVIDHIRYLAVKGAYIVISCGSTKHFLPDGRSSHVTIRPPAWWIEKFERTGMKMTFKDDIKQVTIWLKW